jgi:hypothetical protein
LIGQQTTPIPQWQRFERQFNSSVTYTNPVQEAALTVTFTGPSGQGRVVDGFWDGGPTWRVRFMPEERGRWRYHTACSDPSNQGLHDQTGEFECGSPQGTTAFNQHGPLRLSDNRRYLAHADGTPFFWLADTAWSGPLLSTAEEWDHYIGQRVRQKFTVVQYMTTQNLASPSGDIDGRLAFNGREQIVINPEFFQRLDGKLEALNRAGLLGVPVLLWAAEWSGGEVNELNPGYFLPEDQAILLARYMVARWGAHDVAWILPGDGDYAGPKAERWKRIGRVVFGKRPHAPVSLHPKGMHLPLAEFQNEAWLDINGYQSGHGDDEPTLAWIVAGPPATGWRQEPARPLINLEPPYENHLAYQSRQPFDAFKVRRAMYWSLLVAPTAGVTYGGHGVWGWDDGTRPPTNHPRTGIPLPWREALRMPAAEQMAHLATLFQSIDWPRLRPAPELLADQPGNATPSRYIAAARSEAGDLALLYIPQERRFRLDLTPLRPDLTATWFDPRTGQRTPAASGPEFETPSPGDWLLILEG